MCVYFSARGLAARSAWFVRRATVERLNKLSCQPDWRAEPGWVTLIQVLHECRRGREERRERWTGKRRGKREEVGDGKTKSKDRHCELCVMSIKQILNLWFEICINKRVVWRFKAAFAARQGLHAHESISLIYICFISSCMKNANEIIRDRPLKTEKEREWKERQRRHLRKEDRKNTEGWMHSRGEKEAEKLKRKRTMKRKEWVTQRERNIKGGSDRKERYEREESNKEQSREQSRKEKTIKGEGAKKDSGAQIERNRRSKRKTRASADRASERAWKQTEWERERERVMWQSSTCWLAVSTLSLSLSRSFSFALAPSTQIQEVLSANQDSAPLYHIA